jgi:phosphoglycolate phosphatase-like HAD superfamily hydrolase
MKKVIFDLDGTLINTFYLHKESLSYASKEIYGKELSTVKILSARSTTIYKQIYELFGSTDAQKAFFIYQKYFTAGVVRGALEDTIGITSFIKQLSSKNITCLSLFTGRDRETTQAILKYFHIHDCFSKITCCSNHRNKNDNYYINSVFNPINDSIYLTDSAEEVSYFRDKGVEVYFVNWYRNHRQKYVHTNEIIDINDLLALIENKL